MLDEYARLILRAWSNVVANGGDGSVDEVRAEVAKRGVDVEASDLGRRMNELRLKGQMP